MNSLALRIMLYLRHDGSPTLHLIENIAEESGRSEDEVLEIIKKLEELGLIESEHGFITSILDPEPEE